MIDINILISGAAGGGIQTMGYLLAKAASKSGYPVFAWQEYESRIRGGSNSFLVRISDHVTNSARMMADIMLPFDSRSRSKYLPFLKKDGLIIEEDGTDEKSIAIPFLHIAEEKLGNKLFANSVGVGALAGVLGIELEILNQVLALEFSGKGREIVDKNILAAAEGYRLARTGCNGRCPWSLPRRQGRYYLISGNEALAVGAIAAGCRFMAAYPMTPSTGVITFLAKNARRLGIFTEQAEDEIAAINMAIGASYAGTRAMTATSGGGFSLMVEGLSLAGMTETPVVVILAERPGPATGLPTRTEQGDLLFAINAGHGEFPRIVLAPSDPKDAFHKVVRAFNLADKYQTPAIVLTDQFLADSYFTVEDFELDRAAVESHLSDPGEIEDYRRYALTESGISPRLYPGQSRHLVMCDSDEHDEYGHITEDLSIRKRMVEKRLRKLESLRNEMAPPEEYRTSDAESVLLSWGSARNAVFVAVDALRASGHKVGAMHFTELWPLPRYEFRDGVDYYTVESNATGQLARLLRGEYGLSVRGRVSRYDGLPLDSEYILNSDLIEERFPR